MVLAEEEAVQFCIPIASDYFRIVLHAPIHISLCLVGIGLVQGTSNGGQEIIKTGGI